MKNLYDLRCFTRTMLFVFVGRLLANCRLEARRYIKVYPRLSLCVREERPDNRHQYQCHNHYDYEQRSTYFYVVHELQTTRAIYHGVRRCCNRGHVCGRCRETNSQYYRRRAGAQRLRNRQTNRAEQCSSGGVGHELGQQTSNHEQYGHFLFCLF